MSVPVLSILFMGISAILSIGAPIGLFVFLRKKYGLKIVPMLAGIAAFILFALVLESIMHQLILRPDANGNIELRNRPVLFMLYGGFAAGIFEETARFISFILLKKKYQGFGTALSYGIGHGGAESILLAGLSMISNIIVSLMINSGGTSNLPVNAAQLATINSSMFLISGAERMMALVIQISLSVLVWYAVAGKGKAWLYPAAIVLHAAIDFPAALYQTGAINNIYLVEGLVLVSTVIVVYIAIRAHRRLKQD